MNGKTLQFPQDLVDAWNYAHFSAEKKISQEEEKKFEEIWDRLREKLVANLTFNNVPGISGENEALDAASDFLANLFCGPSPGYITSLTLLNQQMRKFLAKKRNPVQYELTSTGSSDLSMAYVYEVNYTKYYVNSTKTQIKWLNSYVEKYVGANDDIRDSNDNLYQSEAIYYNLNSSVNLSTITDDTHSENILIQNHMQPGASGIGANKYLNAGTLGTLFDFVDIRNSGHGTGIYYKDIEYLVSYTWKESGVSQTAQADLSDAFKTCYESYAAINGGIGRITQDCAQAAISDVITHEGNLDKDVTYTINYVVRDKAGNASRYEARGVLYATVSPSTHVVINSILPSVANSPVVVTDLGNNTYSLEANQGVSIDLLNQAFNIKYASSLANYNKAAVMTIYRDGQLIAENVKGVAFTDYVDGTEIGNYTVVYNMNSVHTTYLGQKIPVSGETITLNIKIASPIINQDSEVHVEDIIKNETSPILLAMIIGCLSLIGIGVVVILKKKKS